MTYLNLINSQEAISRLAKEKLKVKEAVKVARLIKGFTEEIEVFNEQRQKIIDEYGEVVDDGYKIPENKINDFNDAMTELLTTKLEKSYEPIEIESDVNISVDDVIAMDCIITFKEE